MAHIDHGKSTLADRLLELTHAVADRDMRASTSTGWTWSASEGITIKAQAVRLAHDGYELNLIDTPGHVDFTYEVSRSLAACEGAVLLVDAGPGPRGPDARELPPRARRGARDRARPQQDRPARRRAGSAREGARRSPRPRRRRHPRISAKTGEGVEDLLKAAIAHVPAPAGDPDAPLRALVFDSMFDPYRGVITYVRVKEGELPERLEDPADGDRHRVRRRGGRRDGPRAPPGRRARSR